MCHGILIFFGFQKDSNRYFDTTMFNCIHCFCQPPEKLKQCSSMTLNCCWVLFWRLNVKIFQAHWLCNLLYGTYTNLSLPEFISYCNCKVENCVPHTSLYTVQLILESSQVGCRISGVPLKIV